jgi:phosphatidylserine/phosphatidylglycerophosphate/cardiolipin synthase-like enzyme
MVSLSSSRQAVEAIRGARSVLFSSYILFPGAALDALCEAAKAGAHVTVRLEGCLYGKGAVRRRLLGANRRAAAELRRAGAAVHLSRGAARQMHMKAAICDGAAYLDDRNWSGGAGDTIVRDGSAPHVRALRDAILTGKPYVSASFATTKRGAIASEQRLIRSAGAQSRRVDVESESFDHGGEVYSALLDLAKRGVRCRLIVAPRVKNPAELKDVQRLRAAGVAVRFANADEKFAVAGSRAWIGSANASCVPCNPDAVEWGLCTRARRIAAALQSTFDRTWAQAEESPRVVRRHRFDHVQRLAE